MKRAAWLLVALVLAGCGGDDDAAAPPKSGGEAPGGCRQVAAPEPQPNATLQPPSKPLPAGVQQRIAVETTCGAFTITLDPRSAPNAAASFAELAKIGYFDGLSFHRIIPGFVIQGGDPTGTGSGGPGYTTVDTPAAGTTYPRGAVAMAKTAAEAPGTAGSQFFVVTKDAPLPPDYAVIGSVTHGMDVVGRIEALGDRSTELPRRPVIIEHMTLESG